MHERKASQEIIQGLDTTSAKIRALAQAGYDRTEISKLLGIRYQHVRNVLINSGITSGLRRQVEIQPEAVKVGASADLREATSWENLLRSGFQLLGEWIQDSEGKIRLDATAPVEPGVYAFVVEDRVAYVGLTKNGLRGRFDQYRRGHKRQRTSARLKNLITKTLLEGRRVKVLFATPSASVWNELPVNTAAGLEAGLIQKIRPPWNIMGAA